jgi:hypothetical protein
MQGGRAVGLCVCLVCLKVKGGRCWKGAAKAVN